MANTRAATARAHKKIQKAKTTGKRTRNVQLGAPRKARRTGPEQKGSQTILPGGKIPDWQSLPYQVLLSIFKQAAYPLLGSEFTRIDGAASWLIDAATTCKAFCEPALSVLYLVPPIISSFQVQALCSLLKRNGTTFIDYGRKIRQLDLHAEAVWILRIATDMEDLIKRTVNLRGLGLYAASDSPRNTIPRITYNLSAFENEKKWISALSGSHARIRRLHLNTAVFNPTDHSYLTTALGGREFEDLAELSITNVFPEHVEYMVEGKPLHRLHNLRKLSFTKLSFVIENGTKGHVSETELPTSTIIPPGLQSLALIQCDFLTSRRLSEILDGVGTSLRELELRHNADLDLTFVENLGQRCPELEKLVYDLTLFSTLQASSFHEPSFNELSSQENPPTWPETLEDIEMVQLRNWSYDAAELFFKSLIASAKSLRNLRRIFITASVDAGWRERAEFRKNVINPLHEVFKKPWISPRPVSRILHESTQTNTTHPRKRKARGYANLSRFSGQASGEDVLGQDDGTASPMRRSTRVMSRKSSPDGSPVSNDNGVKNLYVQGLCDSVHIRVDNLRPSEDQLKEEDFLDEERSGDEAWDPARGDIDED